MTLRTFYFVLRHSFITNLAVEFPRSSSPQPNGYQHLKITQYEEFSEVSVVRGFMLGFLLVFTRLLSEILIIFKSFNGNIKRTSRLLNDCECFRKELRERHRRKFFFAVPFPMLKKNSQLTIRTLPGTFSVFLRSDISLGVCVRAVLEFEKGGRTEEQKMAQGIHLPGLACLWAKL